MSTEKSNRLLKIGIFYDGNYFLHVSNFYNYVHERQSRISISGLHSFVRHFVAQEESCPASHCQIVEAHYFRSRPGAREASMRGNQLYFDRLFDDILMSEGITTHYFPVRTIQGVKMEKGIAVCLALEAFDLALYKSFDIVVLIASDGDYVPLVRKINALGTKVMLVSWDFEFTDDYGQQKLTRTSQDLLQEVTYPVALYDIVEDPQYNNEPLINGLFVPKPTERSQDTFFEFEEGVNYDHEDGESKISTVLSIKNGYGFIKYPPNNLFFHFQSVSGIDFNDLLPGDRVIFQLDKNDKGEDIAINVHPAKNSDV